MNDAWRWRLRDAITRSGREHSDVAAGAGVTPVTLSRILNDNAARPFLSTIVRIAYEVGVSVGWILNEREFRIGAEEREQLRQAARVILDLTGDHER